LKGLLWALRRCVNEQTLNIGVEPGKRIPYVFDLLYYHSRWGDIGKDSLPYTERRYAEKDPFRYKGYCADPTVMFRTVDIFSDYNNAIYPTTAELMELHQKNLLYLLKIIELAKAKDVALVLIKTPNAETFYQEDEQKTYNAVRKIADENQIPFIDYNTNEHRRAMNLDFNTDVFDESHLNISGSEKFSKYIAAYLKENYDLPDRRGNPAYSSWDEAAEGFFAFVATERARIEAEQMEEAQ
jgi:hypothetical protein